MSKKNIVRTTDVNWFETAFKLFMEKKEFNFIDDAKLGFTKEDFNSPIKFIGASKKKASIAWQQIIAVVISIGISGTGIWLIIVAAGDPEPTSKLGILLAGGVVLTLTGSLGALHSLGVKYNVKIDKDGFKIESK